MELDNAIAETKAVLQPLFSKPKLSSKLLSKPPFRFIHDITTSTRESTGFPDGLFEPHELQSSSYKDDKSAKLAFLDKLIHLVNVGSGSELEVSSSKIVAGLEPLNTNLLLAAFGRLAIDKNLDRQALIQHCRDGLGIDEFRQRHSANNANVEESEVENVPSAEIDSSADLHSSDVAVPSLTELVEKCNEDMVKTIEIISSIVTKPKCSEKLLSKPPFRYLHDLIMAIASASGYDLGQIFSQEMMNSANIKEKSDKLEFLDKLICFLSDVTGISVDVKPSKIVSGLEAERTRYLLQVYTVVVTAKGTQHDIAGAINDQTQVNDPEEITLGIKAEPASYDISENSPQASPSAAAAANSTYSDTDKTSVSKTCSVEHKETVCTEPVADNEDVDKELPDFESWIGSFAPKEMETASSQSSGTQLRLHRAVNSRPATSLMLPTKLSGKELDSIAAAVEGITELTSSLGDLMCMIGTDMEVMNQERIHWTEQIQQG